MVLSRKLSILFATLSPNICHLPGPSLIFLGHPLVIQIVMPKLKQCNPRANDHVIPPMQIRFRHALLLHVVADRIVSITNHHGALPRPGSVPSIGHLWQRLHYHMLQTIRSVNHVINGGGSPDFIAGQIKSVFKIEVSELPSSHPLLYCHMS